MFMKITPGMGEFEATLRRNGVSPEEAIAAHKIAWLKSLINGGLRKHRMLIQLTVDLRVYGSEESRLSDERLIRTYLRNEFDAGNTTVDKCPRYLVPSESFQTLVQCLRPGASPLSPNQTHRLRVALLLAWYTGLNSSGLSRIEIQHLQPDDYGLVIRFSAPRYGDVEYRIDHSEPLGAVACTDIEDWIRRAPPNSGNAYAVPRLSSAGPRWDRRNNTHNLWQSLSKVWVSKMVPVRSFTFADIRHTFLDRTYAQNDPVTFMRLSGFRSYHTYRVYRLRKAYWGTRSLIDALPHQGGLA
jgi:integrase